MISADASLSWVSAFVSDPTPSIHTFFQAGIVPQCFPFYIYDPGGNRRENITDWALDEFRTHYKNPVISKWSIFDYLYGLLHHPGYRARFAETLNQALPPIPLAPEFRAFQRAGQQLIELHLNYEKMDPWELTRIENPGVPSTQKIKLSQDRTTLTVNESLALGNIPPEVFEYHLGNVSALDYFIDEYDGHEHRLADLNRESDPESVVKRIGQVIRLSVETVKIVKGLPTQFTPG